MNIKDLELFITVAKLGSFSKAAKALEMRRALVSRRIADLEIQLGAPLFTRTTRVMALTDSGKRYLAQITPLVSQLNHAGDVFKHRHDNVQGKLRIGLQPFVDKLIDKHIANFVHNYPQVQLEVFIVPGQHQDIKRLNLDCMINAGEVSKGNISKQKLMTFERKMYASSLYLEKSSVIETIDDLHYHSLLGYRNAEGVLEHHWHFQHTNVTANYKIICSDYNSLYHFCLGGAGITLLPQIIAIDAVENQQLINVLPELSAGFTDINIFSPKDAALSGVAKVFIEHLCEMVN
ncbi:LysR family transcriptional regulator [Shewanella inventionis]|uniref:LysR family transcriptional regulator n=1 Tax=Shewanella inventionis TaxID=1738770 RepID=A0ABQ1ING0_9GAMM|nr:LysR family transcriptional regulator [Shewanella inventionis]MCL1156574.1 LysR family transcriptional regulator [Shewanella inventionis]UAL44267.1 LysR family transcriptional regulator [Shewanella inventionis]GGB46572.1 LysR family transcriptional regulator [Shewanella inventionis]